MFFAWKKGFSSAYITASHLGPEWNGVKFGHPSGTEFFEEENYRVRDMVIGGGAADTKIMGKLGKGEALKAYNDYLAARIKPAKRKLKVVVDCGNGTAGLSAPGILRKLGFDVKVLFGEVDGRFPNRPSEIDEHSLLRLSKEVAGAGADIGLAYDGDADRMALMDGKSRLLGPEASSFVILEELASETKGPIIANVECLKMMDDVAGKHKRKLYRIRVGNSFMVHEAERHGACFGVERSGHFCIPSILPMDDGIVASIYAASALSRMKKSLSEIVDGLPSYPFSRMKVECQDDKKFFVMERLKKRLMEKYSKVNAIDGVRVDFADGWVLARASNTEPMIRLSVEADDEKRLAEISKEFLGMLKEEIGKK
jgi:phosphomannomutase